MTENTGSPTPAGARAHEENFGSPQRITTFPATAEVCGEEWDSDIEIVKDDRRVWFLVAGEPVMGRIDIGTSPGLARAIAVELVRLADAIDAKEQQAA